ncbi:hypothetical protein QZH41_007969 [Actinostola sp. cb2023]|nr:hypothetical protein QZH41_007969 [Actinostola sp. cb2023]
MFQRYEVRLSSAITKKPKTLSEPSDHEYEPQLDVPKAKRGGGDVLVPVHCLELHKAGYCKYDLIRNKFCQKSCLKPPSLETVKPPPPSVNSETATSINSETISTPRSGFRYKKWYRFTGTAGSAMPTKCVPGRHCGTHAPGWLSGSHPTQAEGMVTRKVCFTWGNNCCRWNNSIRVRNCGEFYVYELGKTPLCNLRYCGNGGSVSFLVKTVQLADINPNRPPTADKGTPTRIPGPVKLVATPEPVKITDKVPVATAVL